MNPWGFFILALGVLLLIMGVTGSFTKVKAAITGKASTGSIGNIGSIINQAGQAAAGAAESNTGAAPAAPQKGVTAV